MTPREPSAWTEKWLRRLSWREVIRLKRLIETLPPATGIAASRNRRLVAEYFRRKREGGGGVAAE